MLPAAAWIESLKIVLLSRAAFFAVAAAAHWLIGPANEGPLEIWDRWDTGIFLDIAEHGYGGEDTDPHPTAIFPLYPLLIRALSQVGMQPLHAGLLISAVASLVAFAYLFQLAEGDAGRGGGRRAVMYLAFFPTSVFLVAAYSESLFLAGAVPAFYYARKGRWAWAGIPAAVAMGARAAGIFLLFGLLVEFLRQADFRRRRTLEAIAALVVGILPLIGYGLFLWRVRGDPLYFLVDQRLGWQRILVGPLEAFRQTWATASGDVGSFAVAARIEIFALLAGLGFVAWALARREWGYAAYMLSFLAAMASTWYQSIPRMLLTLFPAQIFLAGLTHTRPRLHDYLTPAMALFAALGVVAFTGWRWFF